MAGSHVVVARYDVLAQGFLDSGCIFLSDPTKECDLDTATATASLPPTPTEAGTTEPTATPEPASTPVGSRRCPRCRSRRGTARNASTSC